MDAAHACLDHAPGPIADLEVGWRGGRLVQRVRRAGAWIDVDAPALWCNREAPQPPALHRATLRLRSRGYFTRNPAGHFAIALRAAVTLPPRRDPGSLEGLGFALGSVHAAPGGCPHDAALQVESFWHGGNRLQPGAFAPALVEERWYRLAWQVDVQGRLAGALDDDEGRALHRFALHDADAGRRPPRLAGWFIAAAFTEGSHGDWAMDFADFREEFA
jgi:hypothetical protein